MWFLFQTLTFTSTSAFVDVSAVSSCTGLHVFWCVCLLFFLAEHCFDMCIYIYGLGFVCLTVLTGRKTPVYLLNCLTVFLCVYTVFCLFDWILMFVQCSVCLTVFCSMQCSVCLTVFWCVCTVLCLFDCILMCLYSVETAFRPQSTSWHPTSMALLARWVQLQACLFWQSKYSFKVWFFW